jgi:hypothetical protein
MVQPSDSLKPSWAGETETGSHLSDSTVHLDPQPFSVEVVKHVQQPERSAIAETVRHEVHRPSHVGRIRHCQSVGFVPLQPLAWFDPQVQLQRAVDPIDPLVV